MIKDLEKEGISNFQDFEDNTKSFMNILKYSNSHKHWSSVIEHQTLELSQVFDALNTSEFDEEFNEEFDIENSKKVSDAKFENVKNFVYFEPYIDDSLKIPCSSLRCRSTFWYKRSYKKHMASFHSGMPLQKVRDPVGTCRLIR